MEFLAIVIVIRVIVAAICGAVASSKGRNVVGWAVLGFLFEIIPLIIVCCLSNLKVERQKEAHIAAENRRLREQLRQEQIKGETFRQHAAARLDAHDEKLQLDTRTLGPTLAGSSDGMHQLTGETESAENAWYYSRSGETTGPVPESEISQLIRDKTIDPLTLVWAEHLTEWQPAGKVKTFTLDFLGNPG